MKGVIRFSLNNKFAIWILTLIVSVAGLYAGMNMKQETIPDINVPILTLNTVYPGAAPEEVAENVTKPLEQRIKNLGGITGFNSTSMENFSSLMVEYDYDKNMDKAEAELKEAISGFAKPAGAQDPKVTKISLNDFPVISLSVSGDKSLEDLTKIVENEITPALSGIDGIGTVAVSGQHLKEVQLTFNREKMQSLGLSEDTVKGIVQASAIKVPLGLFELDKSEKTLVVDGSVTSIDDLKNIAIPVIPSAAGGAPGMAPGAGAAAGMGAAPGGKAAGASSAPQAAPGLAAAGQAAAAASPAGAAAPAAGTNASPAANAPTAQPAQAPQGAPAGIPTVKLADIATVELIGKAESISRTNGKESIGINITKAADANTVDVVNAVKAEAKKIEKDFPGVKTFVLLDQGEPIEQSVSTMLNKALFGALFAIIVILLFLRNIRMTLISVVSIPLSLVIALLVLNQMDITLNIMTLGAMTVAIGRVVDDSIVVIENNYRRMRMTSERLTGKALVIDATREMFMPILASTLVTIAVFLPLGFVSGPVGEMFMPFALTMVFALLASLLVAITVVPALAHFMFRKGLKTDGHNEDKPGALASLYRKILNWSLNHKAVTSIIAILALVGSLFLVPVVGVSFLPEEEQKYAMVTYAPGPGQTLEDVQKTALAAEKNILDRAGVTDLQYSVGGQQGPMMMSSSKSALFYVRYEEDTKDFSEVKDKLIADLQQLDPTGRWANMDFAGGGFGGSKLSLFVYGENMDAIKPAVEQIRTVIEKNNSFEKVDTSLSRTYEQYTLVADQQKLSQMGLTAGQIAMKLSPVRERPVLTTIKADGKDYNVYVNVDREQYGSISEIENAKLTSPLGTQVALKDVVKVEKGASANTITRKDAKPYVEVTADITAKDVAKASSDLQKEIDKLELPQGTSVDFGGVTEQINDTFTQLGLAMAAAVAIVYLLLVITFGGGLTPFTILFSLPFIVIGALLGLFAAGETISASAMMGALMLIGIVVTNAIVLIDRVLHKEREGLSTREALLEAGATRLRPILMTALATVGALLPLALGFESTSGSLISKGLGVTVIGGLTSSTLLTLVIVPVVYEFLAKFRRKPLTEDEA